MKHLSQRAASLKPVYSDKCAQKHLHVDIYILNSLAKILHPFYWLYFPETRGGAGHKVYEAC